MKAWYVNMLGAKPGKRGNFEAADLPGVNLTYSPSPVPVVGTRGRALDHIGFEVANLAALCRRIQESGVELDQPLAFDEHLAVNGAMLTDPWGTCIHLTEGLNRVSA
jgi:hypothetical protein